MPFALFASVLSFIIIMKYGSAAEYEKQYLQSNSLKQSTSRQTQYHTSDIDNQAVSKPLTCAPVRREMF